MDQQYCFDHISKSCYFNYEFTLFSFDHADEKMDDFGIMPAKGVLPMRGKKSWSFYENIEELHVWTK